jgi:hypothetical protein
MSNYRDPLALAPSLSGLSEELVEHIASFLAPPDLVSFLAALKTSSSFWEKEAQARARLMQSALRRQLDEVVKAVIGRKSDRPEFTLDDLFPENECEED